MKYLPYICLLGIVMLFAACKKDNAGAVVIRPDQDALEVQCDSFHLQSATVSAFKIYSNTDKLVLGSYADDTYQGSAVDFVATFHHFGLTMPSGAASDSLFVVLYYKSFFGDSLSAHEASAYLLDKASPDFSTNYYMDEDLSNFTTKSVLLGKQSYVAYDATIPQTKRDETGYCDKVKIKLDAEWAHKFLAFASDTSVCNNQAEFLKFFPGVFVTESFGSQTILQIDSVNMELQIHYVPDASKPDSILYDKVVFPANKATANFIHLKEASTLAEQPKADSVEYISSPGGVFVKLRLPWQRMAERIKPTAAGLHVNHASLVVEEALVPYGGRLTPPKVLLLVRECDMEKFFTQSLYPAPDIPTCLALYNEDSRDYTFYNMGKYVESVLQLGADYFDLVGDFVLVPVSGASDIAGTNAVVRHLFKPSAVSLRSGANMHSPMRLVVTHTSF